MPGFLKLMQAMAFGVAFLALAPAAEAQFFDKPGFGGGYRFGPPPPIIYAPPPRVYIPPPLYYAPPPHFYYGPPPRAFYAPPRDFYGSRHGRPHGHRRHW